MMKKVLAVLVVGLLGLVVAARTNFFSYAGTFWNQMERETKRSIPTKFELERIRTEIDNLDHDIAQMIRPVAEYKACIERMRKEVNQSQAKLDENKETLQIMVKDLKGNPTHVMYDGEKYPAERIRVKLAKDFESYKRMETHLKTRQKLLDAKEQALKASQEQLAKVISKKREYEVRVAELEAQEETLQVARIGTTLPVNTPHRANEIEKALSEVGQELEVQQAELEYRTGQFANDLIPVQPRSNNNNAVDVDAIASYLETGTPSRTASNK